MKNLLISLVILLTFISCEKKESGSLKYSKTIEAGCFQDKGSSFKGESLSERDTLTYAVTSDSLHVFVGFNATCCSQFSSSSIIKGDSILIKILTTKIGSCNCLCYYTYDYKFSGNSYYYKYRVTGSNLSFTGQINP